MSGLDFSFLKKQQDTTKVANSSGLDFDFLRSPTVAEQAGVESESTEKEPDLLSQAGNVMSNLWKLSTIGKGIASDETMMELKDIKLPENGGSDALKLAIHDIRNLFGRIGEDPAGAIDAAITEAKKTGIKEIVAGIPAGFMMMLTAPISSVTGLGLYKEELYALTPEERAAEIKATAGNVVGVAAGAGAGKLFGVLSVRSAEAAIAGAEMSAGTKALMQVNRDLPTGALARKLAKGTIEGAAFGSAQASLASANQPDQLTNILINGILFAPVGGAFSLLHGDPLVKSVKTGALNAKGKPVMVDVGPMTNAKKILQMRQWEMTEHLSLGDVARWTESFVKADDLDDAIMSGKMLTMKDAIMLDGINPKRANKIDKALNISREAWTVKTEELDIKVHEARELVNKTYDEMNLLKVDNTPSEVINSPQHKAYKEAQAAYDKIVDIAQEHWSNDASTMREYEVIMTEPFHPEQKAILETLKVKLANTITEHEAYLKNLHENFPDVAKAVFEDPMSDYTNITSLTRAKNLKIQISEMERLARIPERTLIVGKDAPFTFEDKDFFKGTGYLQTEVVSYQGKDYLVRPGKTFNTISLEEPMTGRIVSAPDLRELRLKANGLATTTFANYDSPLSLKGRYLQEAKASGEFSKTREASFSAFVSSFETNNQIALQDVTTGKPITLVGFRQERGPNVDKAGRFYSAVAGGARSYTPGQSLTNKDIWTPAGRRQTLVLHKLELQNPFVVTYGDQQHMAGHNGLVKELQGKGDKNIALTAAESSMLKNAYALVNKDTGSIKTHDPYHLVDRVIAKILKDRGFDSVIYQGGDQIVDLRGKAALDVKQKIEGIRPGIATQESFRQRVFDDFKTELLEDAKTKQATLPKAEGVAPLEKLADLIPNKAFNDLVDDYMKRKGIDPTQRDFILSDFEHRFHTELMASMDPVEKATFERLANAAERVREADNQFKYAERIGSIDKLNSSAESNGFYIDHDGEQHITLRDAETDKILGKFGKMKEAQEFIDATGQRQGIELDGGGSNGLPPRMFGNMQPQDGGPLRPNQTPFIASPDGWFGNITSSFNTIADWLTPNREILIGLDNKFKTKLFSRLYDPAYVGRATTNAAIQPWYHKLVAIENIDKNMSRGHREITAGWLQTKSAAEIRLGMSEFEQKAAQHIADSKGDLVKAFKFNRQLELEMASIKPDDLVGLKEARDKVINAFNLSKEDLIAAHSLNLVSNEMPTKVGIIVRLARTIQKGGGMTRAEYAVHHGMTPKMIETGRRAITLMKELAPQFGITDPENLIHNILTHAQLYEKGDINGTLNFFDIKDKATKDFYKKMASTGEIDAYETDPIRFLQRYIKAGFDAKMMQPVLDQARKSLNEELLKVPEEAQAKVRHVAERYLGDLQGSPGSASRFTQVTVDRMLNGLGINIGIDVRKNIVNTIAATGEAAAQGFRLVAGLRDFYTGVSLYYARFGAYRTGRMLKMGLTGLDELSRKSLGEAGTIPGLSQSAFDTPTEFTSTGLGRSTGMIMSGLKRVGEVGLKLSGQKDVYAVMHAGSYLDTWSLVGEQLRKLNRDEITKEQAYKKLSIESYHAPVAQAFDVLVTAGKFDEAAQMLARATGAEQVGIFGLGNNPGGWNRNIGRIAGQFGSWSMWYRAHVMQMASRGSYGYRAASLARLMATQGVLAGVSAATGVKLSSWYLTGSTLANPISTYEGIINSENPIMEGVKAATLGMIPPPTIFMGGPAASALETVNDAIQTVGPEQNLALARMKTALPFDGEKFNINHIYIPGSYFANDLARAYAQLQQGGSIPGVVARGVGFRFPQPNP